MHYSGDENKQLMCCSNATDSPGYGAIAYAEVTVSGSQSFVTGADIGAFCCGQIPFAKDGGNCCSPQAQTEGFSNGILALGDTMANLRTGHNLVRGTVQLYRVTSA
jgi:hypothetical protein